MGMIDVMGNDVRRTSWLVACKGSRQKEALPAGRPNVFISLTSRQ